MCTPKTRIDTQQFSLPVLQAIQVPQLKYGIKVTASPTSNPFAFVSTIVAANS